MGSRERVAAWRGRVDGFENVMSGLGVAGVDKRTGMQVSCAPRLGFGELDEIYRGGGMAAKLVDTLPNDMTREGWEYKQPDEREQAEQVNNALEALGVVAAVNKALRWARLYGGSVIIIGADDGQTDFSQPLNENNIRAVRFLTVLDRWQVNRDSFYNDIRHPKYGQIATYRLVPLFGGQETGQVVHESRVLRFDGVDLGDRARLQLDGWGDSIFPRLWEALMGYHTAHGSVPAILTDFTRAVYTMTRLSEALAMGEEGEAAVTDRIRQIERSASIVNAMVLDADETWERKTTPVTGLPDLVGCTERRLVAESGMPHTRLLGESPGASLGEGGDSQDRDWYDHVAAQQKTLLLAPLRRLVGLLLAAKEGPTKGKVPPQWSIDFNPLWQLDEESQANIRLIQAQTDAIYLDRAVLSEGECATSRFGGETYSTETTLDLDARNELGELEDDDEDVAQPAQEPPEQNITDLEKREREP